MSDFTSYPDLVTDHIIKINSVTGVQQFGVSNAYLLAADESRFFHLDQSSDRPGSSVNAASFKSGEKRWTFNFSSDTRRLDTHYRRAAAGAELFAFEDFSDSS